MLRSTTLAACSRAAALPHAFTLRHRSRARALAPSHTEQRWRWPLRRLLGQRLPQAATAQPEGSSDQEDPGYIYVPEAPGAQRRVLQPGQAHGLASGVQGGQARLQEGERLDEEGGIHHIAPEAPGVTIRDRPPSAELPGSFEDGSGLYEVGKMTFSEGQQKGASMSSYEDAMAAVGPAGQGPLPGARKEEVLQSLDGMVGNYEVNDARSAAGSGVADGGSPGTLGGTQKVEPGSQPNLEEAAGEGIGVEDVE